jgi:Putative adhesin Stv domain
MARAFILGHGSRVPGREKTFVPTGKSISFYSEVDENTLRSNGLAALNAGDIPPVETFEGESEVDNYSLSRFEDFAIAQHLASESSLTGGTSYFIGMDKIPSPVPLCTTPDACARTKPTKHSMFCKGLFALVPEDELLSVTCRGVRLTQEQRKEGIRNPATGRLGAPQVDDEGHDSSQDFKVETVAEAKRILELSKTDAPAAIAQVESLSEPTRQMLFSNYVPLMTWVQEYYKSGGAASSEAVMEARRALEALGEDSFADHVDRYDQKQRDMVRSDTDLDAAYRRSYEKRKLAREKLERERLGLIERLRTVREEAQHQIDSLQKLAGEMGLAVSNLTGTDSDQDAVASLTTAYGTLMSFVETTQRIGEKEALKTVIANAALVYQGGADLGVALSVYSEIHDADNLQKLKAAMERVLQSAATLTGIVPTDLPDPPPLDDALTS